MTHPNPQNPKRFQNFTVASSIVLVIAIVSVLILGPVVVATSGAPQVGAPTHFWGLLVLLVPHFLVVTLSATGLRRGADVAAIVAGMFFVLVAVLVFVFQGLGGGPDPNNAGVFAFALPQLVMVGVAYGDLASSRELSHQSIPLVKRLLGLALPLGVMLLAWGAIQIVVKRDEERNANQARDARIAADAKAAAWLNHSALNDVLVLAKCIERFRGDRTAGPAPKSLQELSDWWTESGSQRDECPQLFQSRRLEANKVASKMPPFDTLAHPNQEDTHHVVYYEPPASLRGDPFQSARFTLGIEAVWDSRQFPEAAGQPGARNYLLDPNGKIHVTQQRRRATSSDPIVPICASGQSSSDDRECRPGFQSRQRWGMVNIP